MSLRAESRYFGEKPAGLTHQVCQCLRANNLPSSERWTLVASDYSANGYNLDALALGVGVPWPGQQAAPFSDVLMAVRRWLWVEWVLAIPGHGSEFSKLSRPFHTCCWPDGRPRPSTQIWAQVELNRIDRMAAEVEMAKNIFRTGKKVRPKTTVKGKRYRCAKCRRRSPKPVKTPAPWYCPNCLNQGKQ